MEQAEVQHDNDEQWAQQYLAEVDARRAGAQWGAPAATGGGHTHTGGGSPAVSPATGMGIDSDCDAWGMPADAWDNVVILDE